MRETALANPHNPCRSPFAPEICLWENVEFNDELLNIMLTYEYFTPEIDKQAWHLSVGLADNSGHAKNTVRVVLGILGQGMYYEITEQMPEPLRTLMRQFVQEDDSYDPVKKEFK
jgi:hypothetical protein